MIGLAISNISEKNHTNYEIPSNQRVCEAESKDFPQWEQHKQQNQNIFIHRIFFLSSLPYTTVGKATNLRQAVHPPLTSVFHEVSQPLLPVICLLLTEGLKQNIMLRIGLHLLHSEGWVFNLSILFINTLLYLLTLT